MSQVQGTRERLIQAAMRILAGEGASALSNRRIAAEAGVSLGSITYYFETQQDLVRAAMASLVSEETARFTALAERLTVAEADLAAVAPVLGDIVAGTGLGTDHLAWFELFTRAARDPELHRATTEFFAVYDQLARRILRAAGVTEPDTAPLAVGLLIGLQLRKLATGGSDDDVVTAMTRLVKLLPGATL